MLLNLQRKKNESLEYNVIVKRRLVHNAPPKQNNSIVVPQQDFNSYILVYRISTPRNEKEILVRIKVKDMKQL